MGTEIKYTEKLAKYILIAAGIAIAAALCWWFKNVLIYVLVAVVVSLIAKPIVSLMKKISIRGRRLPDWLLAAISLILVIGMLGTFIFLLFPLVNSILQGIDFNQTARSIASPLADLNIWLRGTFPKLGADFRIEVAAIKEVMKFFDMSAFSSWVGSAASLISSIAVAIFSICFISFFFIKDDGLFTDIVCSLVPDKHEQTTQKAITDIGNLLSRYFIGVTVEIMGVALLNFLGLWLIARIGVNAAICIAMITGILNVIPYIGPLMGCVLGTSLALMIKFSSIIPIGLDMGLFGFTAVVLAILCFTQIIDNVLYQPVIYSTSIKSKPLEIFLVLLIVGYIGGPFAMIVAIPFYTVVRVIAFRFFRHVKAIRRLIPSEKLISENQ